MKPVIILSLFFFLFSANAQNPFIQNNLSNNPTQKELLLFYHKHIHQIYSPVALKSVTSYTQQLDNVVIVSAQSEGSIKMDFNYDENDHMTQSSNYIFDNVTNQWNKISSSSYTYNEEGNLTLEITTNTNPIMAGLGNDIKFEYIYNTSAQLHQTLVWNRISGTDTWSLSEQTDYKYDAAGLLIEEISQVANIFTGILETAAKFEFLYDANGVLSEEKLFVFDPFSQAFELESKSEYTFNNEGYLTQQIDYARNTNGIMDFSSKVENTIDAYGCIKEVNSFEYDLDAQVWKPDSKSISEYDYTVSADKLLIPDSFRGMFKYKLTGLNTDTWDAATGTWIGGQNSTYNYSDLNLTLIKEIFNENEVQLFPNPAKDFVTVSNLTSEGIINIYNIKGVNVKTQTIKNKETISVQQLKPGIFFYKLQSNGKTQTGKLLVK